MAKQIKETLILRGKATKQFFATFGRMRAGRFRKEYKKAGRESFLGLLLLSMCM
ncbi:MAG: hypothetical protein AB1480_18480 [Nitrospirota bacterium]